MTKKLTDQLKVKTPKDLYIWMDKNLTYEGYSKEYLLSPEEVIKYKKAHCWESSSLTFTMLKELGMSPYILYLETENVEVTHTTVYYHNNDNYYWLEWAWFPYRGIHEFKNEESLLSDIVNKFKKENAKRLSLLTKGTYIIKDNTKQIDYYNNLINMYKLDINNPKDKRWYRKCVRVAITKGDKVLLGKKIINNKFVGYEFPGGGVEGNDSFYIIK